MQYDKLHNDYSYSYYMYMFSKTGYYITLYNSFV